MIDCEKLEKLYGEELENYLNEHVSYWENKLEMTKKLVADRIARDKELTKPEPKYKVGDLVYFFIDEENWISNDFVSAISVDGTYELRSMIDDVFYERELFPTRQALIEHQIEYWISLKNSEKSTYPGDALVASTYNTQSSQSQVDVDRCQHEHTLLSGFSCSKCGYRKLPVFDSVMYVKPECQHKTDGTNYNNITNEPDFHSSGRDAHLKCKLCGKRYAYEHCQHKSEDIHEIEPDTQSNQSENMLDMVECQHVHDGGFFDLERDMSKRCIKCGKFYRECEHEGKIVQEINGRPIAWECKKCGEFYR